MKMSAGTQISVEEYLRTSYPSIWVGTEVPVQVKPDRCRTPDLVVVVGEAPKQSPLTAPPFLAVEVLSDDDLASDFAERLDDYREFGISYIWVIAPRICGGYVYGPGYSRQSVREGSLRTADPLIEVPLSELFEK